jgi:hypothetical protein
MYLFYRIVRICLAGLVFFTSFNSFQYSKLEKGSNFPQWMSPKSSPKSKLIYSCGYENHKLMKDWFPNEVIHRLVENVTSTKDDLLIYGKFGPCFNIHYTSFYSWLEQNWTGKLFVINGEGTLFGSGILPNSMQIGMSPDSNVSVHVLYMSIVLIFHLESNTWEMLFNHEKKRKSSRDRFCH